MLIKVFGIWLMASNITNLIQDEGRCYVIHINGNSVSAYNTVVFKDTCDNVALEINKQSKLK